MSRSSIPGGGATVPKPLPGFRRRAQRLCRTVSPVTATRRMPKRAPNALSSPCPISRAAVPAAFRGAGCRLDARTRRPRGRSKRSAEIRPCSRWCDSPGHGNIRCRTAWIGCTRFRCGAQPWPSPDYAGDRVSVTEFVGSGRRSWLSSLDLWPVCSRFSLGMRPECSCRTPDLANEVERGEPWGFASTSGVRFRARPDGCIA